ncbi:hypothetical protein [Shewanella gaetbuli]|uniref:Uncharacterized protein n=1 Tax=Shewanella gaetbuli TaxID=220752 RepID=A0A9X1ZM42_9GAMM|nr:hypothetical protein [Shewanella gaetbuli]MCL1143502.1 hypothetical protein [Shewanella gaetbuli]
MKKLLLVSSLLLMTACTATQSESEAPVVNQIPTTINMAGLDNGKAAEELYSSLIKANYLVDKVSADRVAVQLGNHQFVLQPSMNPEGIDRILANRFYAVHPQLHGSKELLVMIGQLNQKLNFAKFFIRENGAVIQVQSSATFVNEIELEEIRRFLIWTDEGLRQVGSSLPKGSEQLIKPIPVMQHPTGA